MLALNAFRVRLTAPKFSVRYQETSDPNAVTVLRAELGTEWSFYRLGAIVYGVPRVLRPTSDYGMPCELDAQSHEGLSLLRWRVNDCLPQKFPQYEAFRHRPFSFLGRRDELVSNITSKWPNVPKLVSCFTIRPRFELDARLIEVRDGETEIAVVLRVDTKWQTTAPLSDLARAGVDSAGLHVVWRDPPPDAPRLVGRVERVIGDHVQLSDAYDDRSSVPAASVFLEGSRASFSRCLRTLLGIRFAEFEQHRAAEEARFLTGPALDDLQRKMEKVLADASPLELVPGVQCAFDKRVALTNSDSYHTFITTPPAEYCFDAAKSKRTPYAWTGLERFGPYSRETFSARTPRILVLCPDRTEGQVGQFLKLFRDGIVSLRDSRFSTGFARTFHLLNPKFETCPVPIANGGTQPVAELYRNTVERFIAERNAAFDAALVIILDEHAKAPDETNPYLSGKATLLTAGIPVQEARLSTITQQPLALQYTLQNLAIALYAKMGGVPWTIDHSLSVDDEIVIGMGTVELSGSRFEARQRQIGITTVFRGDGNYLLSNLSRECAYNDYPSVLEESTCQVLSEIKARNGWQRGDTVRFVFHASKPLKNVETAELMRRCVEQVGGEQSIQFAFLTVSHDHPFRLLDLAQQGVQNRRTRERKAVFVPERGVIAQLGRFTRLVSTNGPTLIKRVLSPLPAPILVHLHRASTYRDLAYLSEQVLKFTALSWRSTLPAARPVTVYYSELIAELLARLRAVPNWSPQVLNMKLRASKWFL